MIHYMSCDPRCHPLIARVVSVSSVGMDQGPLLLFRGEDSAIAGCYWSSCRCEGERLWYRMVGNFRGVQIFMDFVRSAYP